MKSWQQQQLVWNPYTRRFLRDWIKREPRQGAKRSKYSYITNYWRDILYKDPCSYCFVEPSTTADHVIAKANGATKNWSHLVGACRGCNQKKADGPALQFFMQQHRRAVYSDSGFGNSPFAKL